MSCAEVWIRHTSTSGAIHERLDIISTPSIPHLTFHKGDTWSHFFVSGDRSGQVRVWDLRNVSGEPYVCQCFEHEVTQVVKAGSHILACSKRSEHRLISIHDG
ncbi:hypothetical protein PISMIDRAFT_296258 [Pisolithus microcarpus 441]|uniref:Uncharacterized protein n=1 Tax=Pisolithus microcarpus 441 TaxID=765257 RepID=A0A0C9YZ96_9AGAM|nr:hypothetical protein PISMIDRAFT_296258 [Pisolithus microcarpus 441]